MFLQGLDTANLVAMNQQRLSALKIGDSSAKLSSGLKINNSGDDPSGLSISAGMNAQIRGITTAIGNVQDGISLIQTADSGLSNINDLLLRQRDIAVKGANEAVQYTNTGATGADIQPSSERDLANEWDNIEQDIYKEAQSYSFNNKTVMFDYQTGQTLQIGPDNSGSQQSSVVIPNISLMGRAVPIPLPGTLTHAQFVSTFQNLIDQTDTDISTVSDARTQLGAQENNLKHALNDLTNQYQNISGAMSNIKDTDVASEYVTLTKNQILQSAANTAFVQADNEKSIIKNLCDAVGLDASQRVKQQGQ